MKTAKQLVEYVKERAEPKRPFYVLGSFRTNINNSIFKIRNAGSLRGMNRIEISFSQYTDQGYQAFLTAAD